MANVLKREKQIQCLHLLAEGNSIRSTERLTGVHRDTIMRNLVRFGGACRSYLDLSLHSLYVEHAQLDEIWTWVAKKQGNLKGREQRNPEIGDIYLFTALDTDTKLFFSYALGKRTTDTTDLFIEDVKSRLVTNPPGSWGGAFHTQISTDGWGPYQPAIRREFGGGVKHGVIIKKYVNPESGRYAPPKLNFVDRIGICGIEDQRTICTSHVERNNLTIRTFMKRFNRLTMGFSKKLENLAAATALHVATYNFTRKHRSLDGCTPAMAAHVVPELWTFEDLFDNVTEHAQQQKRHKATSRLLKRLKRSE